MPDQPDISTFWAKLKAQHEASPGAWKVRGRTETWLKKLLAALFPQFWREEFGDCGHLWPLVGSLEKELRELLTLFGLEQAKASETAHQFMTMLPQIHADLEQDASALERHDPAAKSVEEVKLAYPGFWAVSVYRIAHALDGLEVPLAPRIMSEWLHRQTGVDIHPKAQIGVPFMIDHGTGVVIGETTVIGREVKIYQGVTLGALSVRKEMADLKRHPTIEDEVVIYAGATILGGRTVIGKGSTVAGGAFLTVSIPPFSLVTRANEVRSMARPDADGFLAYGENI
jgi:serine O-acetyltransferase